MSDKGYKGHKGQKGKDVMDHGYVLLTCCVERGFHRLAILMESFEDFESQCDMSGPVSRTWFCAADLNSD